MGRWEITAGDLEGPQKPQAGQWVTHGTAVPQGTAVAQAVTGHPRSQRDHGGAASPTGAVVGVPSG